MSTRALPWHHLCTMRSRRAAPYDADTVSKGLQYIKHGRKDGD